VCACVCVCVGIVLFRSLNQPRSTTRAIEVPASATSLNSGDAFVVLTTDAAYVWYGKGSSATERKVALTTASKLVVCKIKRELSAPVFNQVLY
jgi:hypothetical protein